MTTDAQKTELLDNFQQYLDQSTLAPTILPDQPDLNTLLSELISLKTEVKVESRHFKNTLDTLNTALESLQADKEKLSKELTETTERLLQQQESNQHTMLLEMVDIYDRLNNGQQVLQNYRPINALFRHSKKNDVRFIKHVTTGQLMTLERFKQLLNSYHVTPIDCIGKCLNPTMMTAVETAQNTQLATGIVLDELRTGFLYNDQVLRLAEVKVNKL